LVGEYARQLIIVGEYARQLIIVGEYARQFIYVIYAKILIIVVNYIGVFVREYSKQFIFVVRCKRVACRVIWKRTQFWRRICRGSHFVQSFWREVLEEYALGECGRLWKEINFCAVCINTNLLFLYMIIFISRVIYRNTSN
jgi:hypothetical protein